MSKQLLRRFALLSLFAMLAAMLFAAEDHSQLVGTWNMTSDSDNGSVDWNLVLKDADGKLTGSLSTPDGQSPAKNFTYENGAVKFLAPYQGEDYNITLRLVGEKLVGTWSGNGNDGRTTGVKAKT